MKVYFKGLKTLVLEQIQQATSSIQLAVAWFTDQDILNVLVAKRQAGVRVVLVLSNDSKNFTESYSLNFSDFKQLGGKLIVAEKGFMHHKFCIIDKATLLTGSANYTYNGFHKNSESIVLTDNKEAIDDFLIQFSLLTGTLNEEEGIVLSPFVQSLQSQINLYNAQISWLEITLSESEKHIQLYEASYRVRFQGIIGEILWLQKLILEHRAKLTEKPESKRQQQEAQQRWESFHAAIEEDNEIIAKEKDTTLQERLKLLYREAVKLCHPDSPLVKDEFKEKARQVFILSLIHI
jgi:phosphatidylserine/phosphatidylglycerophosphate/cardiolipin synthase-like enzyme